MSYTNNHYIEANVVQRVASLPLFDSALKTVVSVYTDVKGRYPLLGVVGGVAEIGVRNASQAAILRATPLLLSLEPQIEVVNNYACMGLDQLEKNFPVLHQSTEEVLGHLKDAFFLTLDDVQLRVNDELDGMQGRWDKLTDATWYYILAVQESQLGQMATSGLDDILTRSEEAMAKYMPLTATLRLEWERSTQQYEDEVGEDEPGLWTRFRGLLLCLSLQLYHRLLKLRNRLEQAMGMLQDATERIGLSRLLEVVGSVLQRLQLLYVYQVLRLDIMRRLALDQLKAQVRVLAELGPVKQLLGLPAQVQLVVADLQELGKILLQLLVNSTPLYNMLQQPSDQDVEDFLNHQESMFSDTTRRSSANSLFLKAMDGRPHKRTSSYARSQRGSTSAPSPAPAKPPNSSRGSQKQDDQTLSLELKDLDLPFTIAVCQRSSVRRGSSSSINPSDPSPVPDPAPANPANGDDQPLSRHGSQKPVDQPLSLQGSQKQEDQPSFVELYRTVCRRSSAMKFLLAPIIQYLSPEPLSDEIVIPEVESTKFHADTRDESPTTRQSLSARSHWSSSNAVARKVETTEDLSPEQVSDEAIALEVESTEYYSDLDARDESPSRCKSLSSHSQRSSSSAGNPNDQPLSRRGSQKPGDQPLSRRGSQKPGDQPLSRRGSQKPDDQPLSRRGSQMPEDQPLSLELDPLELPSTSTVLRPSSAAEVLLGSILQYLSSAPPSDETIIPKVETTEDLSPEKVSDEAMALEVESTEYYSDARDVSPSRRNSLSAHTHSSSSSAGNPDDQPLSRRGSQKPDDQPLSRRGSQKPDDQPLFLELDPLELHSTSTVSHPSLAAEVLRGSILQDISSEPPSDKPVVPEVETTKNHTEARDESPPRSKSLSGRSRRSSSCAGNPSNIRQGTQMRNEEPLSVEFNILEVSSTSALRRRSLAAEVLLGPILQYLSSEPSSDETIIPEVETAETNAHTKDESPPRHQSMSPRSRRSSSSAVVPEVETTEYYFDEGNGSPLRRKSLSIRSCRTSSSGGNAPAPGLIPDNPHNDRQGSQMQDSLEELDTLAFPSTSTVRRRSWAVDVLLDPILQYLNPGHSEKADIEEVEISVVEATEH
ncbi:mucin-4-like [Oncorhynchus masou masou]|uniref:mucin-4-like n=1 Tax=Oncorhynchus masou masou TaxID=90313 RepID=UPI003183522D